MNIAFYYTDWNDADISGTQDAVRLLATYLNDLGKYSCEICNRYSYERVLQQADLIVIATSDLGIEDVSKYFGAKILWNHCWDFIGSAKDSSYLYDAVLGVSPLHAEHLGVDDWCYPGIDPKIFFRGLGHDPGTVVYCGGNTWWKGYKVLDGIKSSFNRISFGFESVWGATHEELADNFRATQFVIIPSDIESFCLVSVQAQACGCIPIAHNAGGIIETIPPSLRKWCLYDEEPDYESLIDIPENAPKICSEYAKNFYIETTAQRFIDLIAHI